jgi:uncharacterized membrane protein
MKGRRTWAERRARALTFFLRGLAVLLPVVLTAWVLVTALGFANAYVARPINGAIYWVLESNQLGWAGLRVIGVDPYADDYVDVDALPLELRAVGERVGYTSPGFAAELAKHRSERESFLRDLSELAVNPSKLRASVSARVHPLIGVLLSLVLVLWLGWLLGGYLGRTLVERIEAALLAMPGVRSIYPYAKQLVDFFFPASQRPKVEFQSVVAVPYPNEYTWSYGFVTNRALPALREHTGLDLVAVFVPSSPVPMTGYTIHIEQRRLVSLPISVDDALRVIVSGGVLLPIGDAEHAEKAAPTIDAAAATANRNA